MTFQQLHYFLEVERSGSFSNAAKKLFVTQSTISNAIASLEKEIGNPLFIRGKKAMTLTPAGEDVLSHAKRICESHRYITTGERPLTSLVRVGTVSFTPALHAFSRLIQENQGRKDIQFAIHDGRNRKFSDDLLAYRLDIAISKFLSPSVSQKLEAMRKSGLRNEILITLPAVVCLGPGHRLYQEQDFPLESLQGDMIIELPGKPVTNYGPMRAYLPTEPNCSIESSHASVRHQLLLEGAGYTVSHMPSSQTMKDSPIRYIPIPGLSYTMVASYDALHPMTPEIARYLELVKEETATYRD